MRNVLTETRRYVVYGSMQAVDVAGQPWLLRMSLLAVHPLVRVRIHGFVHIQIREPL